MALALSLLAINSPAQVKKTGPVPAVQAPQAGRLRPGEFPADGTGTYLAGELVIVDPVDRRGGLRLDGNPNERYHAGPLHYFAMLPCGTVFYNGAPAELRDVPLGTHVHGYFHLPPIGEETTIPPLPKEHAQFEVPQNHAISLEDDFSFYQRQGQGWKVEAIDLKKGKLRVVSVGQQARDGIHGSYVFDVEPMTRVWQQRRLVELDAIKADQVVRLNLGWSPGWRDREFLVNEVWLDDDSASFAAEMQRRRHVRYERQRWLPGWIDAVEPFDYGGGLVTLTLFGGKDPSLYADMKVTRDRGFWVACAEKTLRTWFHRADRKVGQVLEWKEVPNPPPGSSGIRLRLKFAELLDGYRPGRCVRLKCEPWAFVTMPPEERVKSVEDQKRSAVLKLP
jgi:hypothetical protein